MYKIQLFLWFLLLLPVVSLAQNRGRNSCDLLKCPHTSRCSLKTGEAGCVCPDGFTFSDNGQRCINKKMVSCSKDEVPANSMSVFQENEITFTPESGWSKPSTCLWRCKRGYIKDGDRCINQKKVSCNPITPPSYGKLVKKDVIIRYNGIKWSQPASCGWVCRGDYILDRDGKTCINTKKVMCKVAPIPRNSSLMKKRVTINYTTLGGWESTASCGFLCFAGYILEDGKCLNRKKIPCGEITPPEHAKQITKDVTVVLKGKKWRKPKSCKWECVGDYTLSRDKKSCINQKEQLCTPMIPPRNARIVRKKVTVNYRNTKWSKPATCGWVCLGGTTLEEGKCINRKKVACSDITPPIHGEQITKDVTVFYDGKSWSVPKSCKWACSSDYTLSRDKKSCINQKEQLCTPMIPPRNSRIVRKKVTINYRNTKWSKPATCGWVCLGGTTLEDGKCINRKKVPCGDITPPDHGKQITKDVTVVYNGRSWSEPKSCKWACQNDYIRSRDQKKCINEKQVSCLPIVLPRNTQMKRESVTVRYSSNKGWAKAISCGWDCLSGFILEDGRCINRKKIPCGTMTPPLHAQQMKKNVTVRYDGKSWSTPKSCSWRCESDYTRSSEGKTCINEKEVRCASITPPKNSEMISKSITISYKKGRWSKPSLCEWSCLAGYTLEGGRCINRKKVSCTGGHPPKNATEVARKVAIQFDGQKWSTPAYCSWRCEKGYTRSKDQQHCINERTVSCGSVTPPKNGVILPRDVLIRYRKRRWSRPDRCLWRCNQGYALEKGQCIKEKSVACLPVSVPKNSMIKNPRVTIHFKNEKWSQPAACRWRCNHNYTSEDGKSCINRKKIPCSDVRAPKDGHQMKANVTIRYSTKWGWEKPSVCKWECDRDHIFEGNKCIDTKMIPCRWVQARKHAELVWKHVPIKYETGSGWSKPEACGWRCKKNFTADDGGRCISTKMEKCRPVSHPANSHFTTKDSRVYYHHKWGWGKTPKCEWACDQDYVSEDGRKTCIHQKKIPCIDIKPPQYGFQIKEDVPITYTTGVQWSKPRKCNWGCDQHFYPYKGTCMPVDIATSTGGDHSCTLKYNQTVNCWGRNDMGQLGTQGKERSIPAPVSGLTGVVQIDSGSSHNCALIKDGTVQCWGNNKYGQLGIRGITKSFKPVTVKGLKGIKEISVGWKHTCALSLKGRVYCWGRNYDSQLGRRGKIDQFTPFLLPLKGVKKISSGGFHACALMRDSTMRCWGYNLYGQLGDGTTTTRVLPSKVGTLKGVIQMGTGDFHTCALTKDRSLYCWGRNHFGQIGNETIINYHTPKKIMMPETPQKIYVGFSHTVMLGKSNMIYFWGRSYKDWGIEQEKFKSPVKLFQRRGIKSIDVASRHACITMSNGRTICFGKNDFGQLGNGDHQGRLKPTVIKEPF